MDCILFNGQMITLDESHPTAAGVRDRLGCVQNNIWRMGMREVR
jgi:hypothetical protein